MFCSIFTLYYSCIQEKQILTLIFVGEAFSSIFGGCEMIFVDVRSFYADVIGCENI